MDTIQQQEKKLFTVPEAAEYLHLSMSYIYRLIHEHRITYLKPGRNRGARVYFRQEYLDSYINQGLISSDFELSEKANQIINTKPDKRSIRITK
jgi:excisionase family DNA binding protein